MSTLATHYVHACLSCGEVEHGTNLDTLRWSCGLDCEPGTVRSITYRTDGPAGWSDEHPEGCDRLMVHTDADGEPNAAWSATAPYGEGNEDGDQPLYVVTLGTFSSDDVTVYSGPDHGASIAAAAYLY